MRVTNFLDRVTQLERRRPPRRGLSSERRKYLTGKAVYEGDPEALAELNLNRPARITGTKEQREAAVAAGARADT